jgi:clan AA aspartic protease
MIGGTVYGSTDAVVPLTVRGPDGQEERLDFKLDTGFDGDLSLHSVVVAALGLPRFGAQHVGLADGSVILCEMCDGVVEWGGVLRPVEVQVSDSVSLLGMALPAEHQVRIDVVDGGVVRIIPLAQRPTQAVTD